MYAGTGRCELKVRDTGIFVILLYNMRGYEDRKDVFDGYTTMQRPREILNGCAEGEAETFPFVSATTTKNSCKRDPKWV